jgi:hypothetical protein
MRKRETGDLRRETADRQVRTPSPVSAAAGRGGIDIVTDGEMSNALGYVRTAWAASARHGPPRMAPSWQKRSTTLSLTVLRSTRPNHPLRHHLLGPIAMSATVGAVRHRRLRWPSHL